MIFITFDRSEDSMELRHLRYFVVLADELHFGRAAERLFIVQPALSKQIASLERELGVQLFERNRRTVELTPAGLTFLPKARQVLADTSAAVEAAQRAANGESGSVELGFIAPACLYHVPRVLRIHGQSHPEVSVGLTEGGTSRLLDDLQQGRIDVAICRTPRELPPTLISHIEIEEPVLLAVPEDHAIADETEVHFKRLSGEPVIQIARRTDAENNDYYSALALDSGFTLRVTQEADHLHIALALVAAGLGVTFVPNFARGLVPQGVATVGIFEPTPVMGLSVLTRQSRPTPAMREFLRSVRQAVAIDRETVRPTPHVRAV